MIKHGPRARAFLWRLRVFPLALLNLSLGVRLLIGLLSYGVGILGLWFFFPRLGDAASMVVPIICLCWLFSYRGLLLSVVSTVSAIWLLAHFFFGDSLPVQRLVERTVLGLGITFLLGLTICWLRSALDLISEVRQQTLTAEQERLLAIEREHRAVLDSEQQRHLNAMKDQFLLNVSHELRTPVTVLGGSLELLKDYAEQLGSVERERALNQALSSQEALSELVNRVLDTTAMVGDTLLPRPEPIGIYRVLREVLACLAPHEVEAYTICLHVPERLMVWADPFLLRQVLQNLFSNIFKYVPRQTEIHVETMQATPASPVYLSIQDAGPGIPPEELPLLFEKFVRLKRDLAGTLPGLGLGLYLCRQFVEAMKGRIWAESSGRPGEGSRFCLMLPPISFS
ncbi:MAG TPA: HAMP domain-containing sensor histidine kinase [Ktedonobacteraceae bacterium]|jgi:signal transduction histidine kinase